ncbi:MAG: metallophosphoesterase [Candidatus Krumholzibacteriaceae bacterium]|jgi:3',5'-cyclic AMP phosphodiesterase CpdA
MRLGWISDIHLNFLDQAGCRRFLGDLASHDADAWLLGGDIGEAASVVEFLRMIDAALLCKTYFTLGNHDFYGGSLKEVRAQVRELVSQSERLVYLTESDAQLLDCGIAIVGDDSWGDARYGDALGTPVEMNDFFVIEDLAGRSRSALVRTMNGLGDEAAARLSPKLERAAASCEDVVALMHVPPFREAAWHQGWRSDDDWVPWFSCRAVGEAILSCARTHPQVSFLVLCGHTHGSGVYSPLPNVTVHTAEAEYGAPRIQRFFEVGS